MGRRPVQTGLTTFVTIASVAAGSACAGTASAPETTTTPTTTSTTLAPASHGAFGECLRQHGVSEPVAGPAGPPVGVDLGTWDNAMRACGSLAPAPPGPTG